MCLGMKGSDDIGDKPFLIVGYLRRALVALDEDRAKFRLIWSVRLMYRVGNVRHGCTAETKSRAQTKNSCKEW